MMGPHLGSDPVPWAPSARPAPAPHPRGPTIRRAPGQSGGERAERRPATAAGDARGQGHVFAALHMSVKECGGAIWTRVTDTLQLSE